MKTPQKIKSIDFDQAKEEDLDYSLSLTPEQRLKRLDELRELNLGKSAYTSISKKIELIPQS